VPSEPSGAGHVTLRWARWMRSQPGKSRHILIGLVAPYRIKSTRAWYENHVVCLAVVRDEPIRFGHLSVCSTGSRQRDDMTWVTK